MTPGLPQGCYEEKMHDLEGAERLDLGNKVKEWKVSFNNNDIYYEFNFRFLKIIFACNKDFKLKVDSIYCCEINCTVIWYQELDHH